MKKFKKSALLQAYFCSAMQEVNMKKYTYRFANGKSQTVEVTDEMFEILRGFENEEARQRMASHRHCCKYELNDQDSENGIYDEYQIELDKPQQPDYSSFVKTLTQRQLEVLKLLYQGKRPYEVAEILQITKQSVNDIRKSIQKKFLKFFGKDALPKGCFCSAYKGGIK